MFVSAKKFSAVDLTVERRNYTHIGDGIDIVIRAFRLFQLRKTDNYGSNSNSVLLGFKQRVMT